MCSEALEDCERRFDEDMEQKKPFQKRSIKDMRKAETLTKGLDQLKMKLGINPQGSGSPSPMEQDRA